MWIVKNTLRATIKLRGLDVEIPSGEEFDLDTLGRNEAEGSNQVVVAFEEGWFENVYKASALDARETDFALEPLQEGKRERGVTQKHFDDRMAAFKAEMLEQMRSQSEPVAAAADGNLEAVRSAMSDDMKALTDELKLVRTKFASVKGRIQDDPSLSEAEVKARLAFLDEQERELMKNFETVGKQVEDEGGDVMNNADLLSNL